MFSDIPLYLFMVLGRHVFQILLKVDCPSYMHLLSVKEGLSFALFPTSFFNLHPLLLGFFWPDVHTVLVLNCDLELDKIDSFTFTTCTVILNVDTKLLRLLLFNELIWIRKDYMLYSDPSFFSSRYINITMHSTFFALVGSIAPFVTCAFGANVEIVTSPPLERHVDAIGLH